METPGTIPLIFNFVLAVIWTRDLWQPGTSDTIVRVFSSWANDLSIDFWILQVFSMLDTKSLMQASVCCTLFNKCTMDRLCYTHIDLTTAARKADSGVVCIMIHRAGKELRWDLFFFLSWTWSMYYFSHGSFYVCRSLKLGRVARSDGSDPTPSLLNGSFLSPLSYNHGFLGYYPFENLLS